MKNYDPTTATITDKIFVATMLKSIINDKNVKVGFPESVYNYLEYTVNTIVDNINAEVTLDVIKNMAGKKDE